MNNKLIKGISSCVLVSMLLNTGAAAQVAQDNTAAIGTENTSFSGCAEKIRSVYTERYPEQVDVINNVIDDVTSDKTFLEYYEYEGKTAFRILEDTLMDALTPTAEPYSFDGTVAWNTNTVPAIKQYNNYYCGPAAVQMALIGCKISSDTSDKFQKEIGGKLGTNAVDGTNFRSVTPYMNENISENAICKYRSKYFTEYTCNKMVYYLADAVKSNTVPIILIPNTAFLKYYEGYSCSHFVVVKRVDTLNKTITVVDSFYNDQLPKSKNDAFFGEHTITYDDLFNIILNNPNKEQKYMWASVYSYDTLSPIEYIY